MMPFPTWLSILYGCLLTAATATNNVETNTFKNNAVSSLAPPRRLRKYNFNKRQRSLRPDLDPYNIKEEDDGLRDVATNFDWAEMSQLLTTSEFSMSTLLDNHIPALIENEMGLWSSLYTYGYEHFEHTIEKEQDESLNAYGHDHAEKEYSMKLLLDEDDEEEEGMSTEMKTNYLYVDEEMSLQQSVMSMEIEETVTSFTIAASLSMSMSQMTVLLSDDDVPPLIQNDIFIEPMSLSMSMSIPQMNMAPSRDVPPLIQNEVSMAPTVASTPTSAKPTASVMLDSAEPTPVQTKAAKNPPSPKTMSPVSPPPPPKGETMAPLSAPPTSISTPVATQEPTSMASYDSLESSLSSSPPTTKEPITVETNIQLQLAGMTNEMNEESTSIFEQSCEQFLNDFLAEADPPIFDVECTVTNQQLLPGSGSRARGLRGLRHRNLLGGLEFSNNNEDEDTAETEESEPDEEEESSILDNLQDEFKDKLEFLQSQLPADSNANEEAVEPSLLVDVNVKGSVYPTDSVTEPSHVPFDDLVYGASAVQSSLFEKQLMHDASEAYIDDFNSLSNVYVIRLVDDGSNSIESPEGSNNGSDGGVDNTNEGGMQKAGAIAAIVISGVVILGLFGAYFYHVGKKHDDDIEFLGGEDASEISQDVYNDSLTRTKTQSFSSETYPSVQIGRPPQLQTQQSDNTPYQQDITPINAISGEFRNDQLTYNYSLSDGLASPSSLLSQANSPLSMADKMQQQMSNADGEAIPPKPKNRVPVNVTAPAGKLGIIIDTCSEGPIVNRVKDTSPLVGLIFKGDLVVAVDGEDTREWSAHYLTKLVAKKSSCERKFTVMRNEDSDIDNPVDVVDTTEAVEDDGNDIPPV